MTYSMTGFASAQGQCTVGTWTWDIRSVNGRGLDVRTRVPDGFEDLEPMIKKKVATCVHRGKISAVLRVKVDPLLSGTSLNLDILDGFLKTIAVVEQTAMDAHVTLAPMTAADILNIRGVLDTTAPETSLKELMPEAMAQFDELMENFNVSRKLEGDALAKVLSTTLDEIDDLHTQAKVLADVRLGKAETHLKQNVDRLLAANTDLGPDRLAQELAILAVKSDITEELDRLDAHINAARNMLKSERPIGRKFDFLTQEFNREVNTICSKSGDTALTQVGLELKTRVDQMREQVQNVE